eukprot:TRINITY_DN101886_c0_g1_i1.p1 TRINITY_DN101886_c0_g1~~TRINITY_DN101886_c0_g1_i1.p1  ORF type:complete len:716 (-),score=118.28 TRINITY_DN101886_c0_g1_i1:385-2532(-)
MARSHETSWTNLTVDLLRDNPHVDHKYILKKLVPKTLEKGIRFLSQQSKATQGVRHVRLDAWYYIRHGPVDDVIWAVREAGYLTESLRNEIHSIMAEQAVYHVVVRGNDPDHMPLGVPNGQDIVTTYCCEQMELIREEVDRLLFDELADPDAIQQAMSDAIFDRMLENYFRGGDPKKEETLHVVSRFRGSWNLLHTCIKEGYLNTLQLLLQRYTLETQGEEARWRVLAEPLRPCGEFQCSAFHRAVYDARQECLQMLVDWAQRHGHDITNLRNVEERSSLTGPVRGLTCLELAEQEKNLVCYNILAPLFGVPVKVDAVDANPREARLAVRLTPRLELHKEGGEDVALEVIPVDEQDWPEILDRVKTIRERLDDLSGYTIKMCHIAFVSDASQELVQALLAAAAPFPCLAADACTMKSDLTGMSFLRAVTQRLSVGSGHQPEGMPRRLLLSSPVADELDADVQGVVDAEAAALLVKFAELCGRWPGFLGARNGLVSPNMRMRLAMNSDCVVRSAVWSAVYATRVSSFLAWDRTNEEKEDLAEWMRTRELMPLARLVFKFYDIQKLLARRSPDVAHAQDPAVIPCLRMVLTSWFSLAAQEPTPVDSSHDAWSQWAMRLGADEDVVKRQLAPALDLALDGVLRMSKVLDPVCRDMHETSVSWLVKSCVPDQLLSRLPKTRDRLSKNCGQQPQREAAPLSKGKTSLLALPTSLRPRGGA